MQFNFFVKKGIPILESIQLPDETISPLIYELTLVKETKIETGEKISVGDVGRLSVGETANFKLRNTKNGKIYSFEALFFPSKKDCFLI